MRNEKLKDHWSIYLPSPDLSYYFQDLTYRSLTFDITLNNYKKKIFKQKSFINQITFSFSRSQNFKRTF